jgi:hypothetical protein
MVKILRADPGIGFGLRIGIVVASTPVRDDAVTGGGKGRLLIAAPAQKFLATRARGTTVGRRRAKAQAVHGAEVGPLLGLASIGKRW